MNVALIDSALLGHRAKYAFRKTALTTPGLPGEIIDTAVMYGFMIQLLDVMKQITPDQVVFTWDSRHSYRKDAYPEYKKNRLKDKTPEEKAYDDSAFEQFNRLRKNVMPMLGFENNVEIKGLEADDIMASFLHNSDPKHKWTIISTDNDLLQLLTPNVSMYSPFTKKVTTARAFTMEWGIVPKEWGYAKAYAGCNTDNVRGIHGIGMKTAVKYISGKGLGRTRHQAILNGRDIYERNLKLVVLPHEKTPVLHLKEDYLLKESFVRVFKHYGFDSLLKGIDEWVRLFNLH